MPILGNGMMQTMATGKSYMHTFINTEIRGQVGLGAHSAQWAISVAARAMLTLYLAPVCRVALYSIRAGPRTK